jgi:hypothetical protein
LTIKSFNFTSIQQQIDNANTGPKKQCPKSNLKTLKIELNTRKNLAKAIQQHG